MARRSVRIVTVTANPTAPCDLLGKAVYQIKHRTGADYPAPVFIYPDRQLGLRHIHEEISVTKQ